MKNFVLIIISTISIGFISCHRCSDIACMSPPLFMMMRFVDKQDSIDLFYNKKYSPDSVRVYYEENSKKINVEIDFGKDTLNKQTTLYSIDWIQKAQSGIKNYYLYLNKMELDTLYLEVFTSEGCCPSPQINEFKINGSEIKMEFGGGFIYKK